MRNDALNQKQARVLEAVAAVEAANEAPSLARIAERVPLRGDLVESVATELSLRGLLAFHGEYELAGDESDAGPEFRMTGDGQRALSAARRALDS